MSNPGDHLEQAKSGQVTELFPYRMPFAVAGGISTLLIAFCAAVFAAALVVKVPETVRAPFVLMPAGGADPIQSPVDGVIETVHVAAPADVEAGALLFTLRAPGLQQLAADRRTLEKDLAAIAQRRDAAAQTYAVDRRLQEAEIVQRTEEAGYRRQYLDVFKEVRRRIDALAKEGLAPTIELLEQQLGQAEAERDLALAEEQRKAAQLALERIETAHAQALEALEREEARLAVQIEGLDARLRGAAGDLAEVRAPAAGSILAVARRRPGDVVSTGLELCQIAPKGVALRADVQLPERGMARLRIDQPARLLFDAFPYQRYGAVDGTLAWLSPAPVHAAEGGDAFLAHVAIGADRIGRGSAAQPLRAGMKGEARIHTGRRTLIEYAFEPLRRLRENMRGDGTPAP